MKTSELFNHADAVTALCKIDRQEVEKFMAAHGIAEE